MDEEVKRKLEMISDGRNAQLKGRYFPNRTGLFPLFKRSKESVDREISEFVKNNMKNKQPKEWR